MRFENGDAKCADLIDRVALSNAKQYACRGRATHSGMLRNLSPRSRIDSLLVDSIAMYDSRHKAADPTGRAALWPLCCVQYEVYREQRTPL